MSQIAHVWKSVAEDVDCLAQACEEGSQIVRGTRPHLLGHSEAEVEIGQRIAANLGNRAAEFEPAQRR